jgi:hypothetical protein
MASGQPKAAVFVVAMLAGMAIFELTVRRPPAAPEQQTGR